MRMANKNLMDLVRDLPKGPLDDYRRRASFNWKSLKVNLEGEDLIRYQIKLWNFMQTSPPFQRTVRPLTLDETRRKCNAQIKALLKNNFSPYTDQALFGIVFEYDGSLPVKISIMEAMVPNVLFTLGSERHNDMLTKLMDGEYAGCFALTEIAHGSNIKGMRTTATYDSKTRNFVFHSPNFEAAKCWVGGLGQTATHAVVYARLITPDKTDHGLHSFFIPIRDPKTLQPLRGVTVGDLGEKVGLNGVDNGFVMFTNYNVPRMCLLNKTADVTENGEYVSKFKDPKQHFGTSLGALSIGRVNITKISSTYLALATVIAIRYSAARKQFGPSETEEWSVIEYQTQQWRLFPHLAAAYAIKIFSGEFLSNLMTFQINLMGSENRELLAAEGMEIHALSSAAKPLCSWTARDGIQDCREACGGHGYLKASRLGELRNENDANCTYEGENNVLIQQASNWLLNQWTNFVSGKPVSSPLGTAAFLRDAETIMRLRFEHTTVEETLKPENLLVAFKWLVCYYLKKTYEHVRTLKATGSSNFVARNNSQVFFGRTLALIYGEHAVVRAFIDRMKDPSFGTEEREVLSKLCSLYAMSVLERRLGDLYAGGYAPPESRMDSLIRNGIIHLCKELVNEAVALVDVLAPPDFVINSPLGMADGKVYEHIQEWIYGNKENLERPKWWKEMKSKL